MKTAIFLVAVMSIPVLAFSATIIVPDDYPTIQEAIDAAANKDRVIVKPGTYVENIDFLGKAITVESEQGPEFTVIDGNEIGSCVKFTHGEGRDSILQGFKITNGWGTLHEWFPGLWEECGAGIYCNNASPTISENIITDNLAMRHGGGIFCEESSILITNNLFTLNKTYKDDGAGVCIEDIYETHEPVITGNVFTQNRAASSGGAIHIDGCTLVTISDNHINENKAVVHAGAGIWCSTLGQLIISNNILTDNISESWGAAIYAHSPNLFITDNIITGNTSGWSGAGIHADGGGNINITNNVITGNSGKYDGGGIFCEGGGSIAYNIIADNSSTSGHGGGIRCDDGWTITANMITGNSAKDGGGFYCYLYYSKPAVLQNNIICGNSAYGSGGGLYIRNYDPKDFAQVTNNTICDNTAGDLGGGLYTDSYTHTLLTKVRNCIFWNNDAPADKEIHDTGNSLELSYCDIEDSVYATYPGCFYQDPLFVDQADGDCHLTYDSPCRGTGLNTAPYLPGNDFEGDPRIAHGTVDLGADEFYQHLYVTGDAVPGGGIEGKVVGLPGTSPVALFFGSGVLDPPLPTAWGNFHLKTPWRMLPLVPIPGSGVLVLPATIPATPPAPYDLPMQALIGLDPDSLTNLFVLEVR
ncbi:MAG: right-handed parallel beta-helix repeat-containing protein [Planctomycetota bacterium]|jgi:predicted outer membrane repeat protein